MKLGSRTFEWGSRTFVMGVVNVTPDSFSDGGRFFDVPAAIAHGVELVSQGADILDVGGESTRPGAAEVSVADELARVMPVIEGLILACPGVPISIDTSKAMVAERAIGSGAALVNDVTGLRDPVMAAVVAKTGVAACVMHMRGTPRTMQQQTSYGDVVAEVIAGLREAVEQSGVERSRLMVDPGIGFAKDLAQNVTLLRRLGELRVLGLPVLLGTSRKAFLGALSGVKTPAERVNASLASVAVAAANGSVDVVRVHDVLATKQALAVADAIRLAT
jgi:dihydropteroate synthase